MVVLTENSFSRDVQDHWPMSVFEACIAEARENRCLGTKVLGSPGQLDRGASLLRSDVSWDKKPVEPDVPAEGFERTEDAVHAAVGRGRFPWRWDCAGGAPGSEAALDTASKLPVNATTSSMMAAMLDRRGNRFSKEPTVNGGIAPNP